MACGTNGGGSHLKEIAGMDSSGQQETWTIKSDQVPNCGGKASQDELDLGVRLSVLPRIWNNGGNLLFWN